MCTFFLADFKSASQAAFAYSQCFDFAFTTFLFRLNSLYQDPVFTDNMNKK